MDCNFLNKKCILRGTPSKPNACRAIKKPYKGDDCKFRKESDDPVEKPKPIPKPKKMIKEETKKDTADPSEIQKEIKERLSTVGCRYGGDWRKEESFLKGCQDAFKEIRRLKEKERWHNALNNKPKKDCKVLLICLDKDKNDRIVTGSYEEEEFVFDDGGDDMCIPVRWKEIDLPRRTWA